MIQGIIDWLSDPAHWSGDDGIPHRLEEHLLYAALALVIATVIAIPVGLAIGHTGRGRFFVVNLAGAARAIPSLGLLYLMVLWLFVRKMPPAWRRPGAGVLLVAGLGWFVRELFP